MLTKHITYIPTDCNKYFDYVQSKLNNKEENVGYNVFKKRPDDEELLLVVERLLKHIYITYKAVMCVLMY